jgi:predicted phage-related endonuclease
MAAANILTDLEQRSPEWIKMRLGCLTTSRLIDATKRLQKASNGKQKGDYAQCRENYMREVVVERLTGRAADHYVTEYMEDGVANEPLARAEYEIRTTDEVRPVGLAIHPRINYFASSPDALVGDDGLLEIKCLKSTNHLDIVLSGKIPVEFMPQMLGEMSCTGRQWVDFVAYDPLMPPNLQLFVSRFHRNEEHIAMLEQEVEVFLAEAAELEKSLKEMKL